MSVVEHVRTLTERATYLDARISAKRSLGWETQYDERERAALRWTLSVYVATMDVLSDSCAGCNYGCNSVQALERLVDFDPATRESA